MVILQDTGLHRVIILNTDFSIGVSRNQTTSHINLYIQLILIVIIIFLTGITIDMLLTEKHRAIEPNNQHIKSISLLLNLLI